MERVLIRMIKVVMGFLLWVLLHLVIGPCVRNYLEKPAVRLIMRLLGLGDQGPDPAQDVDVERGEAPGLDV